jgi:Holliday junction resolvase
MSEQALQTKILKWLKDQGHYVFKTVVCNRNGVPDIVGCTNSGHFFAIEVKWGANKPSKLQEWNIQEIRKRGGIAMVAYDLDTVKSALAL